MNKIYKIGKVEEVKIYTLLEDYAGYDTSFYAQHGISFLIDVKNKNLSKKILFDVGQSATPILHNMKLLGIDPQTIDLVFLSHCHNDHTKGLVEILKSIREDAPIIAHSSIFRPHFTLRPFIEEIGLSKDRITIENRGNLILTKDPISIMDGVASTGEIKEKVNFEREVTIELYTIKDSLFVKDYLNDEMSLAINLSDGLVVIVGCGHPGIASIAEHAKKTFNVQGVKAVIGGFHLIDADKDRIQKTAEYLNEKVEKIYTGHCTGTKAKAVFLKEFGEKFEELHCGKIIEF
ncbi:MBL fold metallo-hydrolase [Candidatus Aerophobetes bacterium]|nr:MBL fold metallo-hydrolase [Candidatus Aerophobetes bacterium]